MHNENDLNKCPITQLPLRKENFVREQRDSCFTYKVRFCNTDYKFTFSGGAEKWETDETELNKDKSLAEHIENSIKPIRHILIGLILNKKWNIANTILTDKVLRNLIKNSNYPRTPKEKLENLMIRLGTILGDSHSFVQLDSILRHEFGIKGIDNDHFGNYFFFSGGDEFTLYFNTLLNRDFIEESSLDESATRYRLSYNGLNQLIELQEEGKNSNLCFVAMSFDKDYQKLFDESISYACEQTGFKAKKIDDELYESDRTINDAMISLMKRSKFMIADFTWQKQNVYFEAGYCLGRGMKVIYTCKEGDFENSKFDTNHFPHIIYRTNDELRDKLIDKINAFILP